MGLPAPGPGQRHLKPWQILVMVKIMEFVVQTRPRAVWRLLFYRDRAHRRAYRWCVRNAAGVWLDEIHDFVFRSTYRPRLGSLRRFWGEPFAGEAPLTPRAGEPTPFHRVKMPLTDAAE